MQAAKVRATRDTKLERVDREAPAYRVVYGVFGGLTPFVKATGYPKSTVHGWLTDGLIPAPRMAHIRAVARDMKKRLDPAIMVPAPAQDLTR